MKIFAIILANNLVTRRRRNILPSFLRLGSRPVSWQNYWGRRQSGGQRPPPLRGLEKQHRRVGGHHVFQDIFRSKKVVRFFVLQLWLRCSDAESDSTEGMGKRFAYFWSGVTSTGLVIENVTVLRVKACYVMLKLLRHLPTQGQVYVAACAMRGIASVCVCVCASVSVCERVRERERE